MIIQEVVGQRREDRFYPDIAGWALPAIFSRLSLRALTKAS